MDEYREEISKELSLLSDKGKILFAALTSEKLYPNYVFFEKITNWGKSDILREGLALVYQSVRKESLFSKQEIEEAISNVDTVTPHTEDFPGITTSFALDACTSIYSVLSYLLDKNNEYIIDVAVFARDTVDMFVQEKHNLNSSDPNIELKIANDPLMIREKKRQKDLFEKLKTLELDTLTDQMIESLQDRRPIIELEIFEK